MACVERVASERLEVRGDAGRIDAESGAETCEICVISSGDLVVDGGVSGARVHSERVFRCGVVHVVGGFLPESGIIADDRERHRGALDGRRCGGACAQKASEQDREGGISDHL